MPIELEPMHTNPWHFQLQILNEQRAVGTHRGEMLSTILPNFTNRNYPPINESDESTDRKTRHQDLVVAFRKNSMVGLGALAWKVYQHLGVARIALHEADYTLDRFDRFMTP